MEDNIFGLLIEDDMAFESYGGLVVAAQDTWKVTFGFDKQDLLKEIVHHKDVLPEVNQRRYAEIVSQSALPSAGLKAPIEIDGYISLRLAEAIRIYNEANQMVFKPDYGWPLIERIPEAVFNFVCCKNHPEVIEELDDIDLFNALICYSDGLDTSVFIVNSREQCESLIEDITTTSPKNYDRFQGLTHGALLPDTSEYPMISISGEIAKFIYKVVTYENLAYSVVNFGNRPWAQNFLLQ